MPRDGTQTYVLPFPDVVEDTTIESTVYNGFTNDVAQDLNTPRPIKFGGTGAVDAATARFNLATEIAAQVVTNYDSHLWVPGSFYSATTATGEPVDGHAFSGVAYIGEALANPPTNQNVTLEARDATDGKLYIRRKTAGVWGAWVLDTAGTDAATALKVAKAGDTMTGALLMLDGIVTAPAISFSAETTTGMWRVGANQIGWTIGGTNRLTLSNTAITSTLPVALPADPTTALQAATKQYVDTRDNAIVAHGQCRLVATQSAATLTLKPFNGNNLKINGVSQAIPAAGVVYTASGLTTSTIYYVYAFMFSGNMALELSTTGHVTSTTAGNVGVEIKSGDDTRTLVGTVYANNANGNWDDTAARRLARSWFNDNGVSATATAGNTVSTSSLSVIDSAVTAFLLGWAGENWFANTSAQAWNNTVGQITYNTVLLASVSVSATGVHQSAVANIQSTAAVSAASLFNVDGLYAFGMGYFVSGGQGSVAARQTSVTTVRR